MLYLLGRVEQFGRRRFPNETALLGLQTHARNKNFNDITKKKKKSHFYGKLPREAYNISNSRTIEPAKLHTYNPDKI